MRALIMMLAVVPLVSCATHSPEKEYNGFLDHCDRKVIALRDLYSSQDEWFNNRKNDKLDAQLYGQFMFNMGMYHGCIHGVMRWEWFR